jgi:hypothetical protein
MICHDDFEWADLFDPEITAMAKDVATLSATALASCWPASRLRTAPLRL